MPVFPLVLRSARIINLAWERERIPNFVPPFARDEAALWPFPVEEREAIRSMRFNWIRFLWIMLKLHVTNPQISLLGTTSVTYENLERWTDYELALWDALDLETASIEEILATRQKARRTAASGATSMMPFTIYLYFLPAALRTALRRGAAMPPTTLVQPAFGRVAHEDERGEQGDLAALPGGDRAPPTLIESVSERDDVIEIYDALPDSADGVPSKARSMRSSPSTATAAGRARRHPSPLVAQARRLVFHSLRPMLGLSDEEDPAANESRLHERMLEAKEAALSRIGTGRLGRLKSQGPLKWLIDVTQDYIYYRDYERFWNDRTMSRPRDLYTAIARKFVKRGLLQNEEDIFFLGREEVACRRATAR